MTRDETGKILSILKAAYPAQFKGMSYTDGEALLNLWEMELKSYPPDLCTKAARTLMRTSKYIPSIAEMLDQIKGERIEAQMRMLGDIALGKNVPIEDRQRVLGLLPGESYSPGVMKLIEALPDPEEKKPRKKRPMPDDPTEILKWISEGDPEFEAKRARMWVGN